MSTPMSIRPIAAAPPAGERRRRAQGEVQGEAQGATKSEFSAEMGRTGANRQTEASLVAALEQEIAALRGALAAAREQVASLERSANEDVLVALANRRGFMRELARALAYVERYGARAALLYLDLDGFKQINDRHGHAMGDQSLRMVAETLTACVRRSDLVARLGGDEFAVLLWGADETVARAKADLLEAAIARLRPVAGEALAASAGSVALIAGEPADAAIARADAAMYARKRGRGHGR